MPLFKLFGIIENFFGFVGNEQECHYRSDHSKRKHSETNDICVNCSKKQISHVSLPSTDSSSVSSLFTFWYFFASHSGDDRNRLIKIILF